MKRFFTSKQQRKQAEDAIIRDMRAILNRREDAEKQNLAEPVDKNHVMSVLTKFVKLKKTTKFH